MASEQQPTGSEHGGTPAAAPLPARNCYLAPLHPDAGCRRLGEALEGAEFALNEFGQETTAKAACLAQMRRAGGDTFVFAVGRCELWRCSTREALRGAAGASTPAGRGLRGDPTAAAPAAPATAAVRCGPQENRSACARRDASARGDGSATKIGSGSATANTTGNVASVATAARAAGDAAPTIAAASTTGAATQDAKTWVYSELCEYQEPLGGERGQERRSPVFVKLWEWNFADIARECREHLGPNGFDAVQISPVTEHVLGPYWWTKYQAVSFGLNSRSGTAQQLRDMVAACRRSGVEVIVDVILNHVARCGGPGKCEGWDGSHFGDRRLEGARGWDAAAPDHFHHLPEHLFWNCGVGEDTGWLCGSPDMRDCSCCACDMTGLPDWNTSMPAVREMLTRHVGELHSMGVTMLRIDAALYMTPDDLAAVLNRFPWDYVFQEWWGEYPVADRDRLVGHYRDIAYKSLISDALVGADVADLPRVLQITSGVFGIAPERAVYPLAQQDGRSHSVTYKNGLEYHQLQKFFLAWPAGVSLVLWSGFGWTDMEQGPPGCEEGSLRCTPEPVFDESGQPRCQPTPTRAPLLPEQAGRRSWVCEHRWEGVAGLVGFRKACRGLPVAETWHASRPEAPARVGPGRLAFRAGGDCFAAMVRGYNEDARPWWGHLGGWALPGLATGLPPGRYCDVASLPSLVGWDGRSCPREVALGAGGVVLSGMVSEGDLLAIHVGARLPPLPP